MVIFGAAGDLTGRMLIPALYNLARAGLLSREFAVLGVARNPNSQTTTSASGFMTTSRPIAASASDNDLWEWFSKRFYYSGRRLQRRQSVFRTTERQADETGSGAFDASELFLLHGPSRPTFFGPIVQKLSAAGLMDQSNNHWRRVVIEKPFGHDLESGESASTRTLWKVADEKQIYRIDHYLGKETVQNIMAFRFANGIFEPVWNRRYIDHVQISVAETVGVEGRGSYFDTAGTLRDMVPNHIMQTHQPDL